MLTPKMWIDNKWVDAVSGKTYKVVNPATEEEIAQVPMGGFKESGFGKENHNIGLEEYTQMKLISLDLTEK